MSDYRVMLRKGILGVLSMLLLVGCEDYTPTATAELTTATQSEYMAKIQEIQVLDNVARAINDPTSIPSQMTIKQGTGSGNFVFEPGVTQELKYGIPIKASLSGSWTAEAQYQVSPVADANEWHRLRDLFAIITHCVDQTGTDCSISKDIGSLLSRMDNTPFYVGIAAPQEKDASISPVKADTKCHKNEMSDPSLKRGLMCGISEKCRTYLEGSNALMRPWLFWRQHIDKLSPSQLVAKQEAWWHGKRPDKDEAPKDTDVVQLNQGLFNHGVFPLRSSETQQLISYEFGVAKQGEACFGDFIIITQALTPSTNASGGAAPTLPGGSTGR